MIRDTFEANPGLCELFKRKMLERARFVGLSEGLIDFEAQIDLKGTYRDNLRIFYREYPQLSQNSDYFRITSIRPLSGAALEQSWRGYAKSNGHKIPELAEEPTEQGLTTEAVMPELVLTYNIVSEPVIAPKVAQKEPVKSEWQASTSTITEFEPEPIGRNQHQEQAGWILEDGERILSFPVTTFQSILDRITEMAGVKVTKIILHQIGQEIGRTAFNYSRHQIRSGNLVTALDHVLSNRGWGRVLGLDKTDHGPMVTYVCTIKGCPRCDIMRGIVSGWLESFVKKKAESIETHGVATGSQPCIFRVTFRK